MIEDVKPAAINEFVRAADEFAALAEEFESLGGRLERFFQKVSGTSGPNAGMSRRLFELIGQRVELIETMTRLLAEPALPFPVLCYTIDVFIEQFPKNPIRNEFVTPGRLEWVKDLIGRIKRERDWLDNLQKLGANAVSWIQSSPEDAARYASGAAGYASMSRDAAGLLRWWQFLHSVAPRVYGMLQRQAARQPVSAEEFQGILVEMVDNLKALGEAEAARVSSEAESSMAPGSAVE